MRARRLFSISGALADYRCNTAVYIPVREIGVAMKDTAHDQAR